MTLDLETVIMQEIGLGQHFSWFNGSGSFMYVAQSAARELPDAIQKHYSAGEKIAAPVPRLMALMDEAVSWDAEPYILTKAWQVASEVIAAHVHAAYETAENQSDFLAKMEREIRRCYEPEHAKRLRVHHFYDKKKIHFEDSLTYQIWRDGDL
jgi:hypothetical protein